MGTLLFLACVAAVAAVLMLLVVLSFRRARRSSASDHRHQRHQQPLYQQRAASLSRLHSHHDRASAERDVWKTADRHRRSAEHGHAGGAFTANHLRTDLEIERDAEDQVSMSEIKYVPTDFLSPDSKLKTPVQRARDRKG